MILLSRGLLHHGLWCRRGCDRLRLRLRLGLHGDRLGFRRRVRKLICGNRFCAITIQDDFDFGSAPSAIFDSLMARQQWDQALSYLEGYLARHRRSLLGWRYRVMIRLEQEERAEAAAVRPSPHTCSTRAGSPAAR